MKKLLLQFLTIIVLFFATWFLLSKVDWATIFKVGQATKKTEEKLGDLYWELIKRSENEIHSASATAALNKMINRICKNNAIDSTKIKIHLVKNDEVNAFALPNNHLVVYSGLIAACEHEAELCGILSHEIAHMEKNHVMRKLIKEAGISVLISISTGSGGSEMIKETLKLLSSTAYDRNLESEADMTAVNYLINANIDPEQFANFLYKLSKEEVNLPDQFSWISTHPGSEERATKIIDFIKNKHIIKEPVLDSIAWDFLMDMQVKNNQNQP